MSLVFLLLASAVLVVSASVPVWLDVDVSAGIPERDVDDALSIILSIHSEELLVAGVSTVFGNCPGDDAYRIATEILSMLKVEGPVYRGADSAEDSKVPKTNAAVEAMRRAILEIPGLQLVMLGPVTNLSILLQLYPEMGPKIDRAVAVAGRRPGHLFLTGDSPTLLDKGGHPDLNFESDPESMEVLLKSPVPITLVPFEVSSKVFMEKDDLKRIGDEGGTVGEYIETVSLDWLDLWNTVCGVSYFNPFDLVAVAWVIQPDLLQCERMGAWIDFGSPTRDNENIHGKLYRGETKPYLHVGEPESARSVTYCHNITPGLKPRILQDLIGTFQEDDSPSSINL